MNKTRILLACVLMVAIAGAAVAESPPVTIEIAGAKLKPSVPSSADWGWWNPSKYTDGFVVDDDASFEFVDLRMLADYGTYTVVLAGEWYPELEAEGSYTASGDDEATTEMLTLDGAIYDLGFGMNFGRNDRTGGLVWVGATYMDLGETLTVISPAGSSEAADRADTRIWGVVAGVDGSISITDRLDVAGRLLYRWATGDRDAVINTEDPASGSTGQVELSDDIDHSMWGADLGLRWHATKQWWIELGYRYRDRTLDDGPVRFNGPQIKTAVTF